MLEFDESIAVHGTAAAVFDFVANPLNIPRYQAEVSSTRLVGNGPVRVGTRFEETMKMAFATKVFDCTVVELESPGKVAFAAVGSALECRVDFIATPVADGVRLRMRGTGHLKGAWRLLTPMMRREIKHGARRQLAQIKAAVEGERVVSSKLGGATLAVVAAVALCLPVQAAAEPVKAAPPELAKTVQAFSGKWIYEATVAVSGGAPKKTTVTMSCTPSALSKAVSCTFKANVPDSGPYEAALIVGYDTFAKKVHFMSMTSDEEVHDHVCAWTDQRTLACDSLKGGLMGDEVTEELSFTFNGDSGGFKSAMTLKDGTTVVFDATGRRKKA